MQYTKFKDDDLINWWTVGFISRLIRNTNSWKYSSQVHSSHKYFFKKAVWESTVIRALK